MAHLTLGGTSDDGRRLRLLDEEGEEHTLDVDAALRQAVHPARPHQERQLEIEMDSTLRPRDIQARIRSGETAEAVARAAHTTVEKIMPFAGPVLAERQHVAERAQKSSVRRRTGEASAASRSLGDAVGAHLRGLNVDPGTVEWDAFRREDGRWTLTGSFGTPRRSGVGTFTYDVPGSYVVADDEDAAWLVGDGAAGAPAVVEPESAGRRLSAVPPPSAPQPLPPADELPLGDDAVALVHEHPVEQFLRDPEPEDAAEPEQTAELDLADAEQAAPRSDSEPEHPKRKKGRASVPSWDEIMFGGGKGE